MATNQQNKQKVEHQKHRITQHNVSGHNGQYKTHSKETHRNKRTDGRLLIDFTTCNIM